MTGRKGAVAAVTNAGRGLYGLVNNAGVATFGTIANMRMEEFDLTMKVNVYGPVMMIKASRLPERLIRWQMKKVVQWNEGHAYTFDRETLIKMLDDALVNSRPRTEL